MADYADVEQALQTWLNAQTGARAVSETPAAIVPPLIQVVRIGGTDEDAGLDVATVDITTFGVDRASAQALAEQVRTLIREQLPRTRLPGFVVSRTQTISAPGWRPYDDINVRRFGAAYQLTLHRQS